MNVIICILILCVATQFANAVAHWIGLGVYRRLRGAFAAHALRSDERLESLESIAAYLASAPFSARSTQLRIADMDEQITAVDRGLGAVSDRQEETAERLEQTRTILFSRIDP